MERPVQAGATTRVVALPVKSVKGPLSAPVKRRIVRQTAEHAPTLRVAATKTMNAEVTSAVSMVCAMLTRRRDAASSIRTVRPAFFAMHPLCVRAVRMAARRPVACALSQGPVVSAMKSADQKVCVLQIFNS